MLIEFYSSGSRSEWESFLEKNNNFSFQYRRDFLDLFIEHASDTSILVRDSNNAILALMPLSISLQKREIVSHSKSSYGGLLYRAHTSIRIKQEINQKIISMLAEEFPGFSLEVRTPPSYHGLEDTFPDRWILWNLGFVPSEIVLHSVIDLTRGSTANKHRIKQNFTRDLQVLEIESDEKVIVLGELIRETLESRHGITPVHQPSELCKLKKTFPRSIRFFVVESLNVSGLLGGLVFFNTESSFHLQYMAVSETGRSLSVGDLLINHAIRIAMRENARYFNFGHSNENAGRTLNHGLLNFKQKFGGYLSEAIRWRNHLS